MMVLTRGFSLRIARFCGTALHVKRTSRSYVPNRRFRPVANGGLEWLLFCACPLHISYSDHVSDPNR